MRNKRLLIEIAVVSFILFIMLWIFIPKFFGAQNINTPKHFPDLQFLSGVRRAYNINETGILTKNQARNNKGSISVGGTSDLSGLKYFPNITEFSISNDNLGELDFSIIPNVEDVVIGGSNLISVDTSKNKYIKQLTISLSKSEAPSTIPKINVTKNTNLKKLTLSSTFIKSIDLTNCPQLNTFECVNYLYQKTEGTIGEFKLIDVENGGLTVLDFNHNPRLNTVRLHNNNLSTLDLSTHTKLRNLHCSSNSLSKLILGDNPVLVEIRCGENAIEELDLSGCTGLNILYCYNNKLKKLIFGNNQYLNTVYCQDNQLTSLDLTDLPKLNRVIATNNPMKTITFPKQHTYPQIEIDEEYLNAESLSNLKQFYQHKEENQ